MEKKTYFVNYTNRVESYPLELPNKKNEFDNPEDAIACAQEILEGYEPFDGDFDDKVSWCMTEVYTLDANGEAVSVWESEQYWEKQ